MKWIREQEGIWRKLMLFSVCLMLGGTAWSYFIDKERSLGQIILDVLSIAILIYLYRKLREQHHADAEPVMNDDEHKTQEVSRLESTIRTHLWQWFFGSILFGLASGLSLAYIPGFDPSIYRQHLSLLCDCIIPIIMLVSVIAQIVQMLGGKDFVYLLIPALVTGSFSMAVKSLGWLTN